MRFVIDSANVSHERLHDEVIVINLASGSYYSGSGTAADLWTLISSGQTIDRSVSELASCYSADPKIVLRDIDLCIGSLIDRGVLTATREGGEAPPPALPEMSRQAWAAPTFDEYTDMWDLLQADPIHDVGEAGWPYAMPQKP